MPRLPKDTRARRYVFTWNNYPVEHKALIDAFFERRNCSYLIYGREIGESGTPHLQGYIVFETPTSFKTLKRELPHCHLEQAKGNTDANIQYCSKDGDTVELGERPPPTLEKGAATRALWKKLLDRAKDGDWEWIQDNYPRLWIMHNTKFMSLRQPKTMVMNEIQNEWWFGATGTGKSRLAWEKYGNICYQKMLNKWWDGYDMEPVVIIEEWSPKNDVTASALKIWADRYPFTAQIKGGVLQKIRPLKIIVISNYRLSDCFGDARDLEPISRRFTEIEFPTSTLMATARADSMLLSLKASEEEKTPASPPLPVSEDSILLEDVDDFPELVPMTPSSSPIFEDQEWTNYASSQDFARLLSLGNWPS